MSGKTLIATLTGDTFVPASAGALVYVGGMSANRTGSTSAGLSLDLTTISGGVGTIQQGDLVVVSIAAGSVADRSVGMATPAGSPAWVETELYSNDDVDTNYVLAYRFHQSGDSTTYVTDPSGNNADGLSACVHVWRGVDTVTPMDVALQTATGINTGRPTPPAITPTTAGTVIVCGAGGAAATGAVFTQSGSQLSNFISNRGNDNYDGVSGIGSFAWSSGAFTPVQWTGNTTASTDSWAAVTIALRPLLTTPFDDARQAAINGIVSAQGEAAGWNAKRSGIPVTALVRTSDTVITLTIPSIPTYDITAQEVITWTIPASILTGGVAIVATPTWTIDPSVAYSLAAGAGGFSLAGAATPVKLLATRTMAAGTSAFSLSGTDVLLKKAYPLVANAGGFSLIGADVSLRATHTPLSAAPGSFSLVGTDTSLRRNSRIPADLGEFDLAGTVALLLSTRKVAAGTGLFSLDGTGVALLASHNPLVAAAASFNLAGTDVTLKAARNLAAGSGTFALSGTAVSLLKASKLAAGAGAFSLSGTAVTLLAARKLVAGTTEFSLVGQDVGLVYVPGSGAYILVAGLGEFSLAGTDVYLKAIRKLIAAYGGFSLDGTNVALIADRTMAAWAGTYNLTGQSVELVYTIGEPSVAVHAGHVSVFRRRRKQ